MAEVLDQEQVPEVLEQVEDEPAEVLSLLGQLLDEEQRPGRVVVDDGIAEPEERVLFDGAHELQDRLHRDLLLGRGGQLVERRDRIAEGSARAACDQSERRVGGVDRLALAHAPEQRHQLGQPRPLEGECLAA
jgi:hypothetical protein